MDKLSNVLKSKAHYPLPGSTKTSAPRTLCIHTPPYYLPLNRITEKAIRCPVVGPVFTSRSCHIAAGYAGIARNVDVKKIHKEKWVGTEEISTTDTKKYPHAFAALPVSRTTDQLSPAQKQRYGVIEPAHTTKYRSRLQFSTSAKGAQWTQAINLQLQNHVLDILHRPLTYMRGDNKRFQGVSRGYMTDQGVRE